MPSLRKRKTSNAMRYRVVDASGRTLHREVSLGPCTTIRTAKMHLRREIAACERAADEVAAKYRDRGRYQPRHATSDLEFRASICRQRLRALDRASREIKSGRAEQ